MIRSMYPADAAQGDSIIRQGEYGSVLYVLEGRCFSIDPPQTNLFSMFLSVAGGKRRGRFFPLTNELFEPTLKAFVMAKRARRSIWDFFHKLTLSHQLSSRALYMMKWLMDFDEILVNYK